MKVQSANSVADRPAFLRIREAAAILRISRSAAYEQAAEPQAAQPQVKEPQVKEPHAKAPQVAEPRTARPSMAARDMADSDGGTSVRKRRVRHGETTNGAAHDRLDRRRTSSPDGLGRQGRLEL